MSLSPSSGPPGAIVAINGANFGTPQGTSTVTFNGSSAGIASSWSGGIIRVTVPSGATTGNVVVTVNSVASNGVNFTVTPPPSISSMSTTTAAPGAQVTIYGSGFGAVRGTGAVWLGSNYATVVSWGSTQIVAAVAGNARSGTARVQQSGVWSGAVTFNVTSATITGVSPTSGVAGTQVTLSGSGFGSTQGSGQVWLGTANGTVQSWSDTQVVAVVAAGSFSGNAQVLQHGVWSNTIPFTVNALQLAGVNPASATPGTSVTITGTGFGASQGSGSVILGSTAGYVASWSDTQIVATVASNAGNGVVRVQQNGVWSNALSFTVQGATITLSPNMLTMMVGDTRTVQALNAAKQPVTGLAWASSNTNAVSLSSADPPVLTAVAVGHVTVTAGSGSADVTVYPSTSGGLPLGTTLWSVPGNVYKIVPAVPSSSGVADVFAFLADGNTVQAITSDGTTAWTGNVTGLLEVVPDFQGGLVGYSDSSMVKLDGMTGQRSTVYTPGGTSRLGADWIGASLVVHPDGTIFALQMDYTPGSLTGWTPAVVGVDPTTGLKFKVAMPPSVRETYGLIIAGDGNAYAPYLSITNGFEVPCHDATYQFSCGWEIGQITVLRVTSAGVSNNVQVYNSIIGCGDTCIADFSMITNADQGTVLSWSDYETIPPGDYDVNSCCSPSMHMALTSAGSASLVSAPVVAGQSEAVEPVLQAQDGSFVGTAWDGNGVPQMVAFDGTGNVRWSVPGYTPQIATADGGVIATDASGAAATFDQNGNAAGQMGRLTYSWTGNAYHVGSVNLVAAMALDFALSFGAFSGGSPSPNGAAVKLVQSWMFLPAGIGTAAQNEAFNSTAQGNLQSTRIALKLLWGTKAKMSAFQNALATTNMIVGYVGHGSLVSGTPDHAIGMCFGDYQCLVAEPLTWVDPGDHSKGQWVAPNGYTWFPLANGFGPKAKVVFLAMCGVDQSFLDQWHLQPAGQALIAPVYYSDSERLNIDLYKAAWEWDDMLLKLAEGASVSDAVIAGNNAAANLGAAHRWQVIADSDDVDQSFRSDADQIGAKRRKALLV